MDVNAIDLCGAADPLADDLAVAAAENLKRVVRAGDQDWTLTPGLDRMLADLPPVSSDIACQKFCTLFAVVFPGNVLCTHYNRTRKLTTIPAANAGEGDCPPSRSARGGEHPL